MEKRKMNSLDQYPSLLGFGCMRFPTNEDGSINEVEAEKMLDEAIAQGVTYIDTAYPYHNGQSEPFVGKVLDKYPRDSYTLATKLPVWQVKTREDAIRIFNDQLERLHKDYFDFYLLHSLDEGKWQTVLDLDLISLLEEYRAQGKIKYIGFSFHDNYSVFEKIITYRKWDFCQIQYNYLDTEIQAGDKGYELAKSLDIPLVIMEPIKGGRLINLPEDIASILTDYDSSQSLASWALRWVGSHDNVKVILSGMSTMEQVQDNLNTFNHFKPLSKEENEKMEQVRSEFKKRQKNGCTGCAYCIPCPFGINIPKNFQYWNEASMFNNPSRLKNGIDSLKEGSAEFCKKCGACEKMCPQHIKIRENLAQVMEDYKKI